MLVFLLFFQSFGLSVSASDSENLIDTDLRNWEIYDDLGNVVLNKASSTVYTMKINPVQLSGNNYKFPFGVVYDLTSEPVKVGDVYTLSFDFINADKYIGGSSGLVCSSAFKNYNGLLMVGLGSNTDNGPVFDEKSYILIDSSNFDTYADSNVKLSFEMPSGIVNPCIIMYFVATVPDVSVTSTVFLAFSNFSFYNETALKESEKQENFLNRLFAWFQEKFDAIGESFSNLGNKLTDLKNSFVNKLTDLKDSFVLKLEELKQGILNLGDIIIEGIQGLFTPDEAYIIQWKANLQKLLQDNLGIIYTGGDLFITIIQEAFSIISDAPDTYEIKIPEVSFEANGTRVPVFTSQTIDFSFMEKPVFRTMYSMYTVALYIFFGGLEVRYALRVKNKVMSN